MERLESIDRELAMIRENLSRKRQLEARTDDLRQQQRRLENQVESLNAVQWKEENDVRTLESVSLAALFQTILGKREERLEAERREALAARLKCESARRNLEDVESRLTASLEELRALEADETRYRSLLDEKAGLLRDPSAVAEIRELEERLSKCRGVMKEADEAFAAGRKVMEALDDAEAELDSAEGWGTWDLLGGGMVVTMAKRSHMDSARDCVCEAQNRMSRFRTELADVKVSMDIEIGEGDFLEFADYFFDGLIADWLVQSGIEESARSVEISRGQVENVLNRLNTMRRGAEREEQETQERLREVLEKAR
ncbi:MAG: hypothetical protein EOM52_06135 [Clostridia bacterium]|nr:hypothetical protein [Clostridia bacterium]